VPGVAGAICLILTGIAFQILPFSWVGLLLILLGLGFFIAEVFITSFGTLFAAGIICFLLGGTMVFEQPDLSDLTVSFWSVLVPVVLGCALSGGMIAIAVGRTILRPQTSGVDDLIGMIGRSETALDPRGKVFIRGEYWNVVSEQPIEAGSSIEVVDVEGLVLRVRRSEAHR